MGLKHITRDEAEYWGYIGDRAYWDAGLGGEMLCFILSQAKKMGLNELYLKVHRDNARAIRLYTRFGFKTVSEDKEVLNMRLSLRESKGGDSAAFSVKRYTPDRQAEWDAFVNAAKNATFLFRRDYMDYHRDRFADHSLMVYRGGKLAALLPANRAADGTLISHEGLTYGGLVVSRSATLHEVLACFHACLRHLHERQIPTLRYKRIPGFYNTLPDDEVAYALFLLEARLYRRDCAVVVSQADRLPFRGAPPAPDQKSRSVSMSASCRRKIIPRSGNVCWSRGLRPGTASNRFIPSKKSRCWRPAFRKTSSSFPFIAATRLLPAPPFMKRPPWRMRNTSPPQTRDKKSGRWITCSAGS